MGIRQIPTLRIGAFEPRSLANGPGIRAVLWVQGCRKRCRGCFNPELLPLNGGKLVGADEAMGWISSARQSSSESLEGITFSGGEPLDQAGSLSIVARKARDLNLGVLVFTGYTWNELHSKREKGWTELLDASDLLIAGPFEEGNPGHHPLLGSANQEFVFLTDRYCYTLSAHKRRQAEFRISPNGIARVSGFPAYKAT